jgi:hypothetical protein
MKLHPPFHISSLIAPAIKIGGATLSFLDVEYGERDRATFVLDYEGKRYEDRNLMSGVHGFGHTVEIFETFLSFMEACAESYPDGENADLFPPEVAAWMADNSDEISGARWDLLNDDGTVNTGLIEEE